VTTELACYLCQADGRVEGVTFHSPLGGALAWRGIEQVSWQLKLRDVHDASERMVETSGGDAMHRVTA